MRDDKRAFLGMPSHDGMSGAAALGFWRASEKSHLVNYRYKEGSLLCENFNWLWCTALNMVHAGEQIDYFAMQHSDIGPQPGWLDILIDELEAKDLDVLGVVIPIKDPHGLTSLALDRGDDPWTPLCRLTLQEVYRLPETFTSEDVGHRLLLNTGLWVCRFNQDWSKCIHFDSRNEIVFNRSLNRYMPLVEPEDWHFSRKLHKLGLKVGATRKVRATHRGGVEYVNSEAWGEAFDDAYVKQSVIRSGPDAEGFRFPHDVDGWLSHSEGKALFELARDRRVLEIGSYCGRSTICLAQSAKSVVAVDPFDGRGTPKERNTYGEFLANLAHYGVAEKVQAVVLGDDLPSDEFDLVFIDGAHDYLSVKNDIERAMQLIAPGGVIAFHDYREFPGQFDGRWDPGVTQAVNEFLTTGATLVGTHDSLAVVYPPAAVPLEA